MTDVGQDMTRPVGAEHKPDVDDDVSIGGSINRFVSAAKEAADAEFSLAKLRASLIGGSVRTTAILAVLAIILAFATIVTLMVGGVLALAPHWGIGLSLLAVVGSAIIAVIICGLGIKIQFAKLKGFLS